MATAATAVASKTASTALVRTGTAAEEALPVVVIERIRNAVKVADAPLRIVARLELYFKTIHVCQIVLDYLGQDYEPEVFTFVKVCASRLGDRNLLERIGGYLRPSCELAVMDVSVDPPLSCALVLFRTNARQQALLTALKRPQPMSELDAWSEIRVIESLSRVCRLEGLPVSEKSLPFMRIRNLQRLVDHLSDDDFVIPITEEDRLDEPSMLRWMDSHRDLLSQIRAVSFISVGFTVLPQALSKLTGLTSIGVFNDKLTFLSPVLLKPPLSLNVTNLVLSFCKLSSLEGIDQLSQLTYLQVGHNRLTSLPKSMSRLRKLTTLYVHDNLLDSLPPSLAALPKLGQIHASGNRLRTLPSSLLTVPKLQRLHITVYSNYLSLSVLRTFADAGFFENSRTNFKQRLGPNGQAVDVRTLTGANQ